MELNSDWGKNIKAFLGEDHQLIVNQTEQLPVYLDLRDKLVQMPLFKVLDTDYDLDDYLIDIEATKFTWVKITDVIILCRHVEVYKGRNLIRLKMIVKVKPIKVEDLILDGELLSAAVDLNCRPFVTTIELYAFQMPKHHIYKHMYHIKWGHKRKWHSERVDEGKVNDWEEIEKKNLVKFRKDKSLVLFPHILTYYYSGCNDLVLLHTVCNVMGRRGFNYGRPVNIKSYENEEDHEIAITAYPYWFPKFTWCPLQAYLKMFHDRKAGLDKYFLGK
jgi:hypothetical protein